MKKIIVLALGVLTFTNIHAQRNNMKDPVSFKLKNGIEVVVAENGGMGKVYASVKIEGEHGGDKQAIAAVLGNVLNEKTADKAKIAFENNGKAIKPKLMLTTEEGNVASETEDFENAFLVISAALQQPALDQVSLDQANQNNKQNISLEELKAFYKQEVNPSRVYITIAGDITVAQAKVLAKKAFGDWKETNENTLAR